MNIQILCCMCETIFEIYIYIYEGGYKIHMYLRNSVNCSREIWSLPSEALLNTSLNSASSCVGVGCWVLWCVGVSVSVGVDAQTKREGTGKAAQ